MVDVNKSDPTKTILVISVGFAVVFLLSDQYWSLIVSVFVGALGILSRKISDIINVLWMKLAWVLSLIIPNILLSLIFYFFLFPIALMSRVFNKADALQLKK